MKKQHLIPTALLSTFLLATSPAMADPSIADVNLSSAGVDFAVTANLEGSYSLTVSGPADYYFQQDFKSGQAPYFSTFDKAGNTLEAGTYTWTLTHNPVASGDRKVAAATKALRQNGSFTIEANGSLANPNLIEGGLNKAQTFATDLIVQGSACVGFDCTSSESFGFDTLRLKENNLRIHFNDTSSSASFPGNDWRIVANDSSNGGANYFALEDSDAGRQVFKVEAGAIVNALYVDAEGDVGVGTANPVVEVHAVDGNSPTFRLEQDGSNGFTPQTWDLAGNETNFFIRDVTNGSKLPFRIKPGAPDNSIFINAAGNVGVGTDSPDSMIDVQGDGPDVRLTNTGAAGGGWRLSMNGTSGRLNLRDLGTNNDVMRLDTGANAALLRVGINTAGTTTADTVAIGSTTTDAVLQVQGSIVVDGATVHADYVFEPDYNLNTIDEHIEFAMTNKHLPGLPKAPEGLKGPVDLMSHQMGILEELETAHLYIGQLNETIKQLAERLEKIENK